MAQTIDKYNFKVKPRKNYEKYNLGKNIYKDSKNHHKIHHAFNTYLKTN